MTNINSFLENSAEQLNFRREFYKEDEITKNVKIIPLFGNCEGLYASARMLLPTYVKNYASSGSYLIVASYEGLGGLFVDSGCKEFWGLRDNNLLQDIIKSSVDSYFDNNSSSMDFVWTQVRKYFSNTLALDKDFSLWYNSGLTNDFWVANNGQKLTIKFPAIVKNLPTDLHKTLLSNKKISSTYKVFLQANKYLPGKRLIKKEVWQKIIDKLVILGYSVVIWNNNFTYDNFVTNPNVVEFYGNFDVAMSVISSCDVMMDFFSGNWFLGLLGRVPVLSFDSRKNFSIGTKKSMYDFLAQRISCPIFYSYIDSSFLIDDNNHFLQVMVGKLESVIAWKVSDSVSISKNEFFVDIEGNDLHAQKMSIFGKKMRFVNIKNKSSIFCRNQNDYFMQKELYYGSQKLQERSS